MKKILCSLISMALLLCSFASFADNTESELGEIVTCVNSNFLKTSYPDSSDIIVFTTKATKFAFHNGQKKVKEGDIVKYSYEVDESTGFMYAWIIHVYNFDINLISE